MNKNFLIIALLFMFENGITQLSPGDIYQNCKPAVCRVNFYQNISSDAKIGSYDKIKKYRIGILVNSTGLVMVSNDVYPVSQDFVSAGGSFLSGLPTDFQVKLYNGNEYPAQFLGKDDQAMVAFIQIQTSSDKEMKFPFVSFRETSKISVTDSVFILELLTQNFNYTPLFTAHQINAIVDSPRRKFLVNNYLPALSAGGLVLNSKSEAIGVVINPSPDFSFDHDSEFEDYQKNFLEIAPSEWFWELIKNPPNMPENQIAQRSWLGIQMQALTKELKEYWKVPQDGGVIITKVFAESPAEKAKLQSGDIILAVDDSVLHITKEEETANLRNLILSIPPDTSIQLKVFRNGKILNKKLTLIAAPKAIGLAEGFPIPQLGFEIRELTRDIMFLNDLPLNTSGVFVYQVDRASPAGIAGLEVGDIIQEINKQKIENLPEAKKIITYLEKNSPEIYMMKILSGHLTRFVFLDLKK
jgi:serine protease Do